MISEEKYKFLRFLMHCQFVLKDTYINDIFSFRISVTLLVLTLSTVRVFYF